MKARGKIAAIFVCAAVALTGCQKSQKVGSSKLDIQKRADAKSKLDVVANSPVPSTAPSSKAVGIGSSPSPTAKAAASTQASSVFEIKLIHDAPYYDGGQEFTVSAGTKLRVTNADDQVRNFNNPDGAFDSKDIAPGKSWEFIVNLPKGKYSVADDHVPFATANLEVQ